VFCGCLADTARVGPADDAAARARKAFVHAVARERQALVTHERAALMHEESAARLEQAALDASDPRRVDHFIVRAQAERQRAIAARERAGEARRRLRAEGVDPDSSA